MQNYLVTMALSILFEVIKSLFKNPDSKEELRRAMLKLYNAIKAAYAGDPDFS